MEYKLQDLVDMLKVKELLDSLYDAFLLPSAILDTEGNILTASGWQDVCAKFHRVNPVSAQECRNSDLYIMDHLSEADPSLIYCCAHGMVDCATPIIIAGTHMANIFTGQLFLEPPDLDFFRKQAEKYGFDEQAYLAAVAKAPLFTREQLYQNLAVIRKFTEVIGETGLKQLQGIKSKEKLQKNQERLNLALSTSRMGIFEWDIIEDKRIWDGQLHRLMGLPPGTFSGNAEDFFRIIHSNDRQKVEAAIDHAVNDKASYETEFRAVWPDGSVHYIASRGKVHCDQSGRAVRVIGVSWDITERIQAEKKLMESESRFKDIAEKAADMIWEVDASGKFTYISSATKNVLLGYSPDELVGKKYFFDSFLPEAREELKSAAFAAFANKRPFQKFVNPNLHKNGQVVILETVGVPILNKQGDLLGYRGANTDITKRKIVDDQQRFSKQVLSLLNQKGRRSDIIEQLLMLFKQFSGMEAIGIRIREGNDYPYHTSTGFSSEFIEKDRYLCVHGPDGEICRDETGALALECICGMVIQARTDPALSCFSPGGSFWTGSTTDLLPEIAPKIHCFGKNRNNCNQAGYESVALIPLRTGTEIIGLLQLNDKRSNLLSPDFINFMEDVGSSIGIALERIRAEDEIRIAKDEAESACRAKSEFLSTMSHEIRTPLNGILGFAGMLAEELPLSNIADGGKFREYLHVIEQCGESLRDIINDILELSSIESGHFSKVYEEFSPEEHIRQSLNPFIYKAKGKNISLSFKPNSLPEKVIGDCRRLTQILFNLVGNAVKFTEYGGISVVADCASDHLLITVRDSGIGIPADKLHKIMQPFYQADQSSVRKYGGTGLGLTIVHRLLEKLNGTIRIESKENQGTVVSITYPVNMSAIPAEGQPFIPATEVPATFAGLNILVVEDESFNIKYLEKLLTDTGADFKIVDTFAAMRKECLNGKKPDVVLIDISLPDANGFECLQWLQKKYSGQKIKYIAQTAHVLSPMTTRYKEAGFDDFIGKPYKKKEFIEIILKNIRNC
jgi:PAS domain S-box-containing protein